jgi:hypothetical protein
LANIYLTKKIGCLQPHTQSLSQYSKAFVTLFADFVALATPSKARIHLEYSPVIHHRHRSYLAVRLVSGRGGIAILTRLHSEPTNF